jgi:hypothetical protein
MGILAKGTERTCGTAHRRQHPSSIKKPTSCTLLHQLGTGLAIEPERWCILPHRLLLERWAKVRVMTHRNARVFVA